MVNVTITGRSTQQSSTTSPLNSSWTAGTGFFPLTPGDLLVAAVTAEATTSVTAIACSTTGWTQIGTGVIGGSNTACAYFWKKAAGGDTAPSFTSTLTGSFTGMQCVLYELPNALAVGTVFCTSGTATGTTANPLTVTTGKAPVAAGCLALSCRALYTGTNATDAWTKDSAWTNDTSDGATARFHSAFDHLLNPSTGSTLACGGTWAAAGTTESAMSVVIVPIGVIFLVGQGGIAGGNNSTPAGITYSSTAGNTLIITGHLYDNDSGAFVAPTGVTDTASNSWHVSGTSAQSAFTVYGSVPPTCSLTDPSDGASAHMANFVVWCIGAAHITSASLAFEGGVSTWTRVCISEWAGVAQFDNSWAGGSTVAASTATLGPIVQNVLGELLIGITDFGGTSSISPPSGWTALTGQGSTGEAGYLISSATGTLSPVWSDGADSGAWVSAVAVFSPVLLIAPPEIARQSSRIVAPERFAPRSRQNADLVVPAVSPVLWDPPRYPQRAPIFAEQNTRRRQNADFVPTVAPTTTSTSTFIWDAPRYPETIRVQLLLRRPRGVAPTGWPVPVQPAFAWNYLRREAKPPYPRRGVVAPTGWPVPVQPSYNPTYERAHFKPLYPRRATYPTGWPVPVQPTYNPHSLRRFSRPLLPRRATEQTGLPVPIQPPETSESARPRFTRVLLFRRGNVVPTGWPVSVQPIEIPSSQRERSPRRRFLRSGVTITGLPVPVQPPERMQAVRRVSRPLWPRKGVIPGSNLPDQPAMTPETYRARFKPPYPRRGITETGLPVSVQPPEASQWSRPVSPRRKFLRSGVVPPTGLPVPVQPPEIPSSEREVLPRRRFLRSGVVPPSGLPVPVQPPERMQAVRRGSRPLWPRRGVARNVTPPPVVVNPPIAFSERRWSRPLWPRRGVIAPTGWPVPVQPPERMQAVRRWIRPLLMRRGITENTIPPAIVPPTPFIPNTQRSRRTIRIRYGRTSESVTSNPSIVQNQRVHPHLVTRRGSAVQPPEPIPGPILSVKRNWRWRPVSGSRRIAPGIPIQPPLPQFPLNPVADRRERRFIPFRRSVVSPGTGLPIPVQPPERMQFVRRWIRPLLPRRGVTPEKSLPLVIIEVKLPVWVWITIGIPGSEISISLPLTAISVYIPSAAISLTLPYTSITIIIPLENEEQS